MKLYINKEEREIKTRHCPYCGRLLEYLNTEMDAREKGKLYHKKVEHPDFLEIDVEETEWTDTLDDAFYCPECGEQITTDLSKAKEFIQLPETEEEK